MIIAAKTTPVTESPATATVTFLHAFTIKASTENLDYVVLAPDSKEDIPPPQEACQGLWLDR